MTDSCRVCGARRMWIPNSKDGLQPEQIDDHKQAAEINAMLEDERIAREQEQQQQIPVEAVVPKPRKKKMVK